MTEYGTKVCTLFNNPTTNAAHTLVLLARTLLPAYRRPEHSRQAGTGGSTDRSTSSSIGVRAHENAMCGDNYDDQQRDQEQEEFHHLRKDRTETKKGESE